MVEALVEDEKPGLAKESASDFELDALAGGERLAAGGEMGLDAVGEGEDIAEEADFGEGFAGLEAVEFMFEAEAEVIEDGAVEDFGLADDGDVGAEVGEADVAIVAAVDFEEAVGGFAEGIDEIEEGAFAGASGADDADACAGGNVPVDGFEEAFLLVEAHGHLVDPEAGAVVGAGEGFAGGPFRGEVFEVAEFVDGGHQIVEGFEVLAELGEAADDEGDDDFGGDELAKSQLAVDDKPASTAEQDGESEGLDGIHAEDLAEKNAEVLRAVGEIGDDEAVGFLHAEDGAGAGFEGELVAGDFLEPGDDGILGLGLADGSGNGAGAHREQDKSDEDDKDGIEDEEERMVNGQQGHADEGLEGDREAVNEESGSGFLDSDDVEEAIDEFGTVVAVEGFGADFDEAEGGISGDADEDAPLHDFDDPEAVGVHHGVEHEGDEHEDGEGDERLDESAESDGIDHGLGGDGEDERDQADGERIDDHDPHVRGFGGDEVAEAGPGVDVVPAMGLIGRRSGRRGEARGGAVAGVVLRVVAMVVQADTRQSKKIVSGRWS